MSKEPGCLQQFCMNAICNNADLLHEVQGVALSENLSEQLLQSLSEKGKLDDETLLKFNSKVTTLVKVVIRNSDITSQGLRILREHRVSHLELTGNWSLAVDDVVDCLGEWSLSNLKVLLVRKNKTSDDPKSLAESISKLTNLRHLTVSHAKLNQESLEILVENMPHLDALDISSNEINDISPLKKLKSHLKSLSIYNLRLNKTSDPVSVLNELSGLLHLDISTEPPHGIEQLFHPMIDDETERFPSLAYLSRPELNPCLVTLDISGAMTPVSPDVLKAFIDAHPSLTFLGLTQSSMSNYQMFRSFDPWFKAHPNLKTSGKGTDDQMKETLRRYLHRPEFLVDALKALFPHIQYREEPREDIIELVIPAWKRYPRHPTLQWAAVAVMGLLTNGERALHIHPHHLHDFIELTVRAMEYFPDHPQILHNGLQGLCNTDMMQILTYDWFRPLSVIMSLLLSFNDDEKDEMAVIICSQLIKKMSRVQVTKLGTTHGNLRKLLILVKRKLANYDASDMTLKFSVACLLSLTDECPLVAKELMDEDGFFDLLVNLLKKASSGDTSQNAFIMIIRGLCVLGNIAEVKELQPAMVREDFLELMRGLLHHENTDILFSTSATLVHLCIGNEEAWAKLGGVGKSRVLEDLHMALHRLDTIEEIAFRYRSLGPFYQPLQSPEAPVQLWGMWTLHFLCSTSGEEYLPILEKENGDEYIKKLMTSDNVDPKVKDLCQKTLHLVEQHKKF